MSIGVRSISWNRRIVQQVEGLKRKTAFSPSTSMADLAEWLDVEIVDSPLDGPSGLALPVDDVWVIALKPGLSDDEHEITIAHEIAHAVLGITCEIEAERLAAELVWDGRYQRVAESLHAVRGDKAKSLADVLMAVASLQVLVQELSDRRKIELTQQLTVMIGFGAALCAGLFGLFALIDRAAGRRLSS